MAKKKRHIHLLKKLQAGKALSKSEIKELESLENKNQLPDGTVDSQKRVAKAFGVTVRTVQHWLSEGMPVADGGFYDLVAIQKWRTERESRRAGDKPDARDAAEIRFRESRADLAELELKEKRGELVRKADTEREMVKKISVLKMALLNLPNELAPQLAKMDARKIQLTLVDRIRTLINNFAGKEVCNDCAA